MIGRIMKKEYFGFKLRQLPENHLKKAKKNVSDLFSFLSLCKNENLMPDTDKSYWEGEYDEKNTFWIIDNISSINVS